LLITFYQFQRIELWGANNNLDEACKQWDSLANEILLRKRKKGKSWAKPEKAPLNKKQEAKLERRKKREQEAVLYTKLPRSPYFPFNGYFVFPDNNVPIARFLGKDDKVLDPLRIEKKCHIWYEPTLGHVSIFQIF
jgi:hypothetical protein